jgi:hypothetical protein
VDESRCRTRKHLANDSSVSSWFSSFLPPPNLLEVVQQARSSHNPRETCPRWAERPAAEMDKTPISTVTSTRKWEKIC